MYKYIDILKKERNIFINISIFDNILVIKYNLLVILKIKTKVMKKLWGILVLIFGLISLFFTPSVSAWFVDDIFGGWWAGGGKQVPICADWECSINDWLSQVEWTVEGIVTDITASQYIQKIVQHLLTFLGIVGVIYIIFAWFQVLVWAWDEEKLKSSKSTILYVAIGLLIIFLAAPIFQFIVGVFDSTAQTDTATATISINVM